MASKLIKSLKGNKLFSLKTVEEGTINDVKVYHDSGSYVLNLVLSGDMFGGYTGNRITAIAGDSGTGKTFLVLAAAKEFLNNNKKGTVIYFDTEGATDAEQISGLGIDTSRFEHQGVRFIEEISRMLLIIAEEQKALSEKERQAEPLLIIIDSIGNISTSKEVNDLSEGNDKVDMTKAKKLNAMFRAVSVPLTEAGLCTIFTNHVYDTQDMYSQKVMKGGSGLMFLASTILFLAKKKDKEGTEVVGNIIRALAKKARKAKMDAVVNTYISYKTGLNKHFGLLELAETVGIVKRVGNRYEFPDGEKYYLKDVLKNPDSIWTKSILQDLNEKVKPMFNYGSSITDDLRLSESEEELEAE